MSLYESPFRHVLAGAMIATASLDGLASALPEPKIILSTSDDESRRQRLATHIIDQADADGTIGVIVRLDMALHGEGRPLTDEERTAILQIRQDELVARIQGRGRGIKKYTAIPYLAMRVTPSELDRLLADPEVAGIEEDVLLHPMLKESTKIVGAARLWLNTGVTGENQIVAVVDSGVDPTHPMLRGKIIDGACFSTNSPSLASLCPNGSQAQLGVKAGVNCPPEIRGCEHGTHVASIAAGAPIKRLSGVAPDAEIIAIQAASKRMAASAEGCSPQPCADYSESDILAALNRVYQIRNKFKAQGKSIAAINLSLGLEQHASPCDSTPRQFALAEIVERLRDVGIATVVAGGNAFKDGFVGYPACLSQVIAVGATEKDDSLWSFTNLGPLTKLLAPGVGIRAAVPKGSPCSTAGDTYCTLDGTSQATPHVAGAFALLRAAVPEASVSRILAALSCSGRPIQGLSALHASNKYHRPRLNVMAAHARLTDPESGESYAFNATSGRWKPVIGHWNIGGGAYQTQTVTWPEPAPWGLASLDYCSPAFTVEARLRQLDPAQPANTPLETGLLLASHITEFAGTVRASGYLFTIGSLGRDGRWVVKRIEDKAFSFPTLSDEATLCDGLLPDLKLGEFHNLKATVAENRNEYFVDDKKVCAVNIADEKPRYAPPAKIALAARRGVSGLYSFFVDSVKITPSE